MKKKITNILVIVATVAMMAGCSSDSDSVDPKVEDCFAVGNNKFSSLNDAVKAAINADDENNSIIHLLANTSDDIPLTLDEDAIGLITLDLGKFRYTSISDKGLDFKKLILYMNADGGKLICKNGQIASEGSIVLEKDFKGEISAPIALTSAEMWINSQSAEINISELNIKEEGLFCLDVPLEKPTSIVIDKLIADGDYKVCAVDHESIVLKTGGKVHVHDFKLTKETGPSCYDAGSSIFVCETCQEQKIVHKEGEKGHCIVERLEHHPAVTPTETEWGNVEYWTCKDCGKTYSDSEGNNYCSPYLTPTTYDLPSDLLLGFDNINMNDSGDNKLNWKKLLGKLLLELLSSAFDTSTEDFQAQMSRLASEIQDIKFQLKDIQKTLTKILKVMDGNDKRKYLDERFEKINTLYNKCAPYFDQYCECLKSPMTPSEKKEKIELLLTNFGKDYSYAQLCADLQTLVDYYYNAGLNVNVPTIQEKYTQSIYLWENLGYELRIGMTLNDFQRLAVPYLVINSYMNTVSKRPEDNNRKTALQNGLTSSIKAWRSDSTRIEDRNNKYRIFCADEELTYYQKEYTNFELRFQEWLANAPKNKQGGEKGYCFPRMNNDNKAVVSCEKFIEDMGLKDGHLELRHVLVTEDKFKKGANFGDVARFIGFEECPEWKVGDYWTAIIFARTGEDIYEKFGHQGGEDALPYYKLFSWYVDRDFKRDDFFSMNHLVGRKDLLKDNWTMALNFRFNMRIQGYGTGNIKEIGKARSYKFYTYKKVKNVNN